MNRAFLELEDCPEAVTRGSFAQDKPAWIHFRFDAQATTNCALACFDLAPLWPFCHAIQARGLPQPLRLGFSVEAQGRTLVRSTWEHFVSVYRATQKLRPGCFVKTPQLPVAGWRLTFLLHIRLFSYPGASSLVGASVCHLTREPKPQIPLTPFPRDARLLQPIRPHCCHSSSPQGGDQPLVLPQNIPDIGGPAISRFLEPHSRQICPDLVSRRKQERSPCEPAAIAPRRLSILSRIAASVHALLRQQAEIFVAWACV